MARWSDCEGSPEMKSKIMKGGEIGGLAADGVRGAPVAIPDIICKKSHEDSEDHDDPGEVRRDDASETLDPRCL